ncbi:MAG: hypothetical protein EOO96_16715 [Pedobacter sp.]|nr:MAG: hypothetical protein EOO96_16715 [Pedobacter sp.]
MRIVIFITIWTCIAIFSTANAQQNSSKLKDTLIIQIEGNSQLHIIGSSMKELAKYDRADSLKNLFVADYNKALNAAQITNSTQRIHYLISKEGQRRMKAAGDAYTEEPFELEAEKKRFQFNLPKMHYTIYDFAKDVEMHFYLADSSGINKLENFHIGDAIKMLSEDKKLSQKYFKLKFETNATGYNINEKTTNRRFEFAFNPVVGITLIGDRLSPIAGGEWGFVFTNKYNIPKNRIGFLFNGALIYDKNESALNKFSEVLNYEGSFSFNASKNKNARWAGFHIGIISGLENFGLPRNTAKFGFHFPVADNFTYSLDFISDSRKNISNLFQTNKSEKSIYSMTVRAWF